MRISETTRKSFAPILAALEKLPADLKVPGALVVRPGYRYDQDPATNLLTAVPAIVVSVMPDQVAAAAPRGPVLATDLKVPVEVQAASLEEQLGAFDTKSQSFSIPETPRRRTEFEASLRGDAPVVDFAIKAKAKTNYVPPDYLKLERVKDQMHVKLSVSPEQGWNVLKEFLDGVEDSFSLSMYQFTAPQIADSVTELVKRIDGDITITLHPVPEKPGRGVKKDDRDEATVMTALQKIGKKKLRFQWAPVFGADALFASSFHIKVAVADGKRFWLSSGNWQSSNQPGDDVPKNNLTTQRKYNRDYHAVIQHQKLAETIGGYLKYDFENARKINRDAPNNWEGPDVTVPADYEPPFAPAKVFEPLELNRVVDVLPLLTPDNYAPTVLDVIKSAKKRLWFQNQYINLKDGDNIKAFEDLVDALIAKQDEPGFELRIICRDMMGSDKRDLLVAKGLNPDNIRFQPGCHNKCILADSSTTVFGSHNWSNDGAVLNRDASLVFYDDEEIAKYFEKVYDYDWSNLATAHPAKPKISTKKNADDGGDDDAAVEQEDVEPALHATR